MNKLHEYSRMKVTGTFHTSVSPEVLREAIERNQDFSGLLYAETVTVTETKVTRYSQREPKQK